MLDDAETIEPVEIRDWEAGDLAVVGATMGAAAATRHLGGPEPAAKLAERHARYLALAGTGLGRMFVIVGPGGAAASLNGGEGWSQLDARAWWGIGSGGANATWITGPEGRIARLRMLP